MPLGAGRGVQGHAGCGQPEHEPLYSEQELTTQTLSTFLQEGRELGWGEVIAPQQAALGSRSGPAARDMGNCFSAPRALAVGLGAGWEGTSPARLCPQLAPPQPVTGLYFIHLDNHADCR